MSKLKALLPSPHSLIAFEAAARNLSFKLAARELNVTQPSISHAVKLLERRCQTALFVRENRGVRLTEAGRVLFEGVRAGFARIEESLESATRKPTEYLTLATSTSLAAHWLMPQLYEFQRDFPDIHLRVLTTDRDIDPDDEVDMTVWLRPGNWQRPNSHRLCDEVVFPVCTPHYRSRHPDLTSLADLSRQKLIHSADVYRERLGWKTWLALAGADFGEPSPDFIFNDYQLALQATLGGEGVALGWSFTSQVLIRNRMLVRPVETEVNTGNAFFFVANRFIAEDGRIGRFFEWLFAKTADLRECPPKEK